MRKLFLVAFTVLFTSCATIYTTTDVDQILSSHQSFAILPLNVNIQTGNNNYDYLELNQAVGLAFRKALSDKILDKSNHYRVKLQNINHTDSILKQRFGNDYLDFLSKYVDSLSVITNILGVDGIVIYRVKSSYSKSNLASLALATTTKIIEPVTEIRVLVRLYDIKTNQLIWEYDFYNQGLYFTDIEMISKPLVIQIRNKIPYFKK